MPKRSTDAQRARERQQSTGESYTKALRSKLRPSEVLYAAVRAENFRHEMTRLSDIFQAERRRAPFLAEAERLEELVYHAQGKMPWAEWQALRRQADAAWSMAGADEDLWAESREVLWVAGAALARAGSIPDGRKLAAAAAVVLGQDDSYLLSDWVRCPGRSPRASRCSFVACHCEFIDSDLTGPDTVWAREARAAVRALACAARVPHTGNDEDWTAAAELLEEALAHAQRAADRPVPDRT